MKNILKKVLVVSSDNSLSEIVGRLLKSHDPAAEFVSTSNRFEPGTYFTGVEPAHLPSLIIITDEDKQERVLQNVAELKSSNQTAHIPIIVITTIDDEDYRSRFYKSKVNCLLMKPTGESSLREIITAVLHLWVPNDSSI